MLMDEERYQRVREVNDSGDSITEVAFRYGVETLIDGERGGDDENLSAALRGPHSTGDQTGGVHNAPMLR